jgi:hypothetical protein
MCKIRIRFRYLIVHLVGSSLSGDSGDVKEEREPSSWCSLGVVNLVLSMCVASFSWWPCRTSWSSGSSSDQRWLPQPCRGACEVCVPRFCLVKLVEFFRLFPLFPSSGQWSASQIMVVDVLFLKLGSATTMLSWLHWCYKLMSRAGTEIGSWHSAGGCRRKKTSIPALYIIFKFYKNIL